MPSAAPLAARAARTTTVAAAIGSSTAARRRALRSVSASRATTAAAPSGRLPFGLAQVAGVERVEFGLDRDELRSRHAGDRRPHPAGVDGLAGRRLQVQQGAPGMARVAAQQERVDRGRERRSFERLAVEGRVLARGLDLVDEGSQPCRRQRPAFGRLGEPRPERGGVGQGGEAGALRRRARQEARRRRVALQHARPSPGASRRAPTASAAASTPASSAADTATRVPASGAPTSARRAASRARSTASIGLRSESWPRQGEGSATSATVATTASATTPQRHRGSRAAAPRMKRPSWRRRPAPRAPSGAITGKTKRVVAAAASRPASENTPSWARPGKPAKTSAAKPISDVSRPSRTVGQLSRSQRPACDASPSRRRADRGAGLDQVVDRVVDRFADQGGAEAEGHAVHLAEDQRDGGDAGEHAGRDRQQGDGEGAQRCEREPEEDDHDRPAPDRQPLDLALDPLARGDAEAAGARELEPQRRLASGLGARTLRRLGEGPADRVQGLLLAVEIGAVGARGQHQHRARRGARDPDAVLVLRRLRRASRPRRCAPSRRSGRAAGSA